MKKLVRTLMLAAVMLLPMASHAQLSAIYEFSTGVDNSMWYTLTSDSVVLIDASSFTTSTSATTGDSKKTDVTNIGFTFNFAGEDYTQFSANSDGTVRLGATQIGTSGYGTPFSTSNASVNAPKICGLGCDGCMVLGDYIAYQLFGTEGDHVLVIEISTGSYSSNTRANHYTFQVQLAEADNSVTVVYSPTAPAAGPNASYQLGASAGSNDIVLYDVTNHTLSTHTAGVSTSNAAGTWPEAGRYYTMTPNPNACFPVTDLAIDATQTTNSSLTLTWADTSNSAASYEVYSITATDTIFLGTVSATSYTVSGLDANTVYEYGVVANCGSGNLANMVTIDGRTSCNATTPVPYSENFSGYTGLHSYPYYGPSVIPGCWEYYGNGTNTAETSGTSVYFGGVAQYSGTSYGSMESGNPYLCLYIQITGSAVTSSSSLDNQTARGNTRYAVLPAFDEALNGLQISFDYKMSTAYSATGAATTLELGYITTDTASFVSLQQYQAVTTTQHVEELSLATLAAAAPAGARLAFRFSGEHNGTGSYSYSSVACGIDNIMVEELPSCFHVTDLAISASTTSSMTLTWSDDVNTGATYTVSDADGIIASGITAMTYTVENLDANTEYTFSVVANCSASDASEAETVTGRTACTSISIDGDTPYTENFDSYTVSVSGTSAPTGYPNTVLPNCWSFLNMSDNTSSYPQVFMTSSTTYAASGNCLFFKSSSTTPLYAVMPEFEATGDLQLVFDYRNEGTTDYNGTILVGVMTNASDASTFVALDSCERTTTITNHETVIPASALVAGARVAFCYRGGTSNNYYASVDNVIMREAPSCLPVVGLAVSNITANTATLTWQGDADGYTIWDMSDTSVYEYATDTTIDLYALDPMTSYTFGVTSNCGSIESDMRTISFTTACSAVDLPYTETFDATSGSRTCWSLECSNTNNIGGSNGAGFVTVSGREVMRFSSYSNSTDYNQYGFSPMMNVSSSATNLQVTVVYATYGSSDQLNFGYVTATDTVWDPTTYTTTGISDWQTQTFVVPATATQLAAHYYGNFSYYAWIDSVVVTELTTEYCYPTTGLTVSNITATSATVTWNSSTVGNYVLYIMNDSSDYMYTDTVADLNTLQPNTEYTVGVTVDCPSGESPMITTTFRTACASETLPYSESFDSWTSKSPCWSFLSGAYNMGAGTPTAYSSAWTLNSTYGSNITISGKALTMNVFSTNRYWAVTPPIEVTSDNIMLSVDVAVSAWSAATPDFDTDDTLAFAVSTDGGTTFTHVAAYGNTELNALTGTATTLYVPISGYSNETIRIAIFAGSAASGGDNRISIDSISVTELTGDFCAPVTAVTVDSANSSSISLSWTSDGTDFTVVNMADGTVAATTTDTYVTISGLTASTAYTFGVVNNCPTVSSDTVTIAAATPCENMCTLTVDAVDGYGDGWTGSYIDFVQNGVSVAQFSMADQMEEEMEIYETAQVNVCSGSALTLNWVSMSTFDYEASFTILNASGDTLFTADSCDNLATPFYTVADPCAGASVEVDSVYVVGAAHGVFAHGTVTPMMSNVAVGESITFTATPDSHYVVEKWIASYMDTNNVAAGFVTFDSVMGVTTYTYTALATHVDGVVSVMAYFVSDGTIEEDTSVVLTTSVNDATMGTITPAPGTHEYFHGDTINITITPNAGYHVETISISTSHPILGTDDTVYTSLEDFMMDMESDTLYVESWLYGLVINVSVVFAADSTGPQVEEYTVTVNYNNAMGNVTVNGQAADNGSSVTVAEGSSVSFTANAYTNYEFVAWVDNGDTVGRETVYTINAIDGNHVVTAVFREKVGVADVELDNVEIFSADSRIYVRGAEGQQVTLFDVNGRMMSREATAAENVEFRVNNSGVYLVKVGNAAAKRVVVIR